jgi:hypothetical protein
LQEHGSESSQAASTVAKKVYKIKMKKKREERRLKTKQKKGTRE